MVAKKQATKKAGWKTVTTKANFVKFEKIGDSFHGIFQETKTQFSKKFKYEQTIWICIDVATGEIVQITETAVMTSLRLNLNKGDEFILNYTQDVQSDNGMKPYKDYELLIKE